MKFHINTKTGRIGQCKAKNGQCPFGSEQEHFSTREQAKEHALEQNHKKYKDNLYKSSSKTSTPENIVNKDNPDNSDNIVQKGLIDHPENNVFKNPKSIAFGDKIIFNAWIGDRRRELHRHLIDNDKAKVMNTVKDFTIKDIKEAIKLGYLPKDMKYRVEILEDEGFGKRVLSVESIHPDKTSFEMKEFIQVPMKDGSVSIIPQTKKEYIEVKEKLESIADNYNMRRKTLDGYHESDFYVHAAVNGGKDPDNIDDDFSSGKKILQRFYEGNASEQELEKAVQNHYAHEYEKKVYEELQKSNVMLKENSHIEEVKEIVSESLQEVEQEVNIKYRTSTSITMDYLKGEKLSPNEEKLVAEEIKKARKSINRKES